MASKALAAAKKKAATKKAAPKKKTTPALYIWYKERWERARQRVSYGTWDGTRWTGDTYRTVTRRVWEGGYWGYWVASSRPPAVRIVDTHLSTSGQGTSLGCQTRRTVAALGLTKDMVAKISEGVISYRKVRSYLKEAR